MGLGKRGRLRVDQPRSLENSAQLPTHTPTIRL
jgi:hypothetical protein